MEEVLSNKFKCKECDREYDRKHLCKCQDCGAEVCRWCAYGLGSRGGNYTLCSSCEAKRK